MEFMARSPIIFIVLTYIFIPFGLHGQHFATHEVSIQVDNDQFIPNSTDRYYSNGIVLSWDRTVDTTGFLKVVNAKKAIITGRLEHKIYTPSEITYYDQRRHDRPYASTLVVTGGLRFFTRKNQFMQADITLGVSGPMALGQKMQEWWHQQIGIFRPRGWENQIANSPVVAMHFRFSRQWFQEKFIDVISNSEINIGSMLVNMKHGAVVRIGNPLPLLLSAYAGGNLQNGPIVKRTEVYLLFGGAFEYVNHNGLIEGNWIGNESPHTMEREPWVFHGEYGIELSTWKVSAGFIYKTLSKEVRNGARHRYASIKLGFRF